jgi:hypothetical protein
VAGAIVVAAGAVAVSSAVLNAEESIGEETRPKDLVETVQADASNTEDANPVDLPSIERGATVVEGEAVADSSELLYAEERSEEETRPNDNANLVDISDIACSVSEQAMQVAVDTPTAGTSTAGTSRPESARKQASPSIKHLKQLASATLRETIPLSVTIARAVGLRNDDFWSKSDPYCVMQVRGRDCHTQEEAKFRTKVIKNELNPVWDETFEFEFEFGGDLVFEIYDEDTGKEDDFLGTVTISQDKYLPNGFTGFALLQKTGKQAWEEEARIYLIIKV